MPGHLAVARWMSGEGGKTQVAPEMGGGVCRPLPTESSDWKRGANGTEPGFPTSRSHSEAKRSRLKWRTESKAREMSKSIL